MASMKHERLARADTPLVSTCDRFDEATEKKIFFKKIGGGGAPE